MSQKDCWLLCQNPKICSYIVCKNIYTRSCLSELTAKQQQLTLLLLNTTCLVLANSVDPDQLASEEDNWSGSALFALKYVNLYQQPGSSNLIGWKLEVGGAS